MQATRIYVLLSAFLAIKVSGLEAPIPGYSVFIPEWEVQATPGGESLIMNGTVENIFDGLNRINPNYFQAFGIDFSTFNDGQPGSFKKRGGEDWSHNQLICHNFDTASVDAGWDGIKYLERVKGKPKNSAGPASCGQISCSWNTAIWWCNDDDKEKELDSFATIAHGAQYMWARCTDWEYFRYYSSGQIFSKDNWNVLIRESDKHC